MQCVFSWLPVILRAVLFVFVGAVLVSGCASLPPSSGALSRYDTLGKETGYLAKKRVASNPILLGAVDEIFLAPVRFDVVGVDLTSAEKRHISAVLNRSLCQQASRRFRIASEPGTDRLSVHVTITGLTPTKRIAALASGLLPLRPPLGLGALTVEGEAITLSGEQAGAMVWARKADPVFASARASRIGDAYNFAGQFGQQFGKVLRKESKHQTDDRKVRTKGWAKQDKPCAAFGGERLAAGLLSIFSPIEPPPEWSEE